MPVAHRPVGAHNEQRSRKGEEREPANHEINPGYQVTWRFSSRNQVRPPM